MRAARFSDPLGTVPTFALSAWMVVPSCQIGCVVPAVTAGDRGDVHQVAVVAAEYLLDVAAYNMLSISMVHSPYGIKAQLRSE